MFFLKFPLGKRFKTFCQVNPRNLVVVKANGSLDPTGFFDEKMEVTSSEN